MVIHNIHIIQQLFLASFSTFSEISIKKSSVHMFIGNAANKHASPTQQTKQIQGVIQTSSIFYTIFRSDIFWNVRQKSVFTFFCILLTPSFNACYHIIYVVGAGNNDRKIGCILYFFIIIYSIQSGYKQLYILERTHLTFEHCSFMVL